MAETRFEKIAFVVATRERPRDLRVMLASLQVQSRRPVQVVIVDSSAESDEKVAAEFPDLRIAYLRHGRPSATAQRNAGARAVDPGVELVCFMDDDAVLLPGALEAMLEFWESEGKPGDGVKEDGARAGELGGASFNQMNFVEPGGGWLKRSALAERLGLYASEGGRVAPSGWQTLIGTVGENTCVDWLPSTASVWRRDILDEFEFDEYFDGYSYLEDLELSYRVGRRYRLAVVAAAGYCHYPSASARVNGYRFGEVEARNRVYIVRKHGLSPSRCYLGILVRLAMTLGTAARTRDRYYLERAAGYLSGALRSLVRD